MSPAQRRVIVVDQTHQTYVDNLPGLTESGRVVHQPTDRGTAAGVLLPLTWIMDTAPDAIVVLTPSDHGVASDEHFQRGLRTAVKAVQSGKRKIVLFGAEPTVAHGDYGWITPTSRRPLSRMALRRVAAFVEKPSPDHAEQLLASGAVWSTMVLVARASTLFDLHDAHVPELSATFRHALKLPHPVRQKFLADAYKDLPVRDFSRDVVSRASDLTVYTWPAAMGWSDLGTPDRLDEWMRGAARRRRASVRPAEGQPSTALVSYAQQLA